LQYELAAHAIEILPSGGIFGYATCSPHMAETRAQCATIEKKLPVEKIDVTPFLPENLENGVSNGYMQLWPHRHDTDAMFLALYRKR
jgi:16S rRNA (cytosine967-C5)-methyltransferase